MIPVETKKKLKYLAAYQRIDERHDALLTLALDPASPTQEDADDVVRLLDELVDAAVLMGRTYGEDGLSPSATYQRLLRTRACWNSDGFVNQTPPDDVRADLPVAK